MLKGVVGGASGGSSGGPVAGGVANSVMYVDASGNLNAANATNISFDATNNILRSSGNVTWGYTTTATAAGTTTLTAASTRTQRFTGATTQTIVLPVVSTLPFNTLYDFINDSTGILTVNSSGGNLVATIAPGVRASVSNIIITGTSAASWQIQGGIGLASDGSVIWQAANYIPVAFASLPAAASSAGQIRRVSDIGVSSFGSLWVSNGTRWSPLGGTLMLKTLGAQVSGIDNTETIVLQTLLPIGAWQTNDTLRLKFGLNKSGTTDGLGLSVRIGTAGTVVDTAIAGFSTSVFMSAANVSGGYEVDIKLLSATTAQKQGTANGAVGSLAVASATAVNAADTITSAAANALYCSLTIKSQSTNNTVGIGSGQIQLITP